MRRCPTGESCGIGQAARVAFLDLPVVDLLSRPKHDWELFTSSIRQRGRTAAHAININWQQYPPEEFMFSHCSIVSSVATDETRYRIVPPCDELVNINGNAWTNHVIPHCFRTFVGGENYYEHCFVAGTRVLMEDGTYLSIEYVQPGQKVIDRTGKPAVVLNVQRRKSKDLYKIESNNLLGRQMVGTGRHPMWVFHARDTSPKTGKQNKFDRDLDFFHLDTWRGLAMHERPCKGEVFGCGVAGVWSDIQSLDANRDFLTSPVSERVVACPDMNEKRAELVGWFLAEGSYMETNSFSDSESGVVFSLGNDEQAVADRISSLLTDEFGDGFRSDCQPRIRRTDSGSISLSISNKEVADYLIAWCGKHSWNKVLSKDALWLPVELQAIILDCCLKGDGCSKITSRGYTLTLRSQRLVQQLLFISWRLGLRPTYAETGVLPRYSQHTIVDGFDVFVDPSTGKKSRPGFNLSFSIRDSVRLCGLFGRNDFVCKQSKRHTKILCDSDGKWILSKIDSVVKLDCNEEQDVFNLEIQGDNSYIAEGVVVHNCQVKAKSKGKILDAVLRPVTYVGKNGAKAEVYYCDILIATARKHRDIVSRVESGSLNTLSMGAIANKCQCSYCGKITDENTPNCFHLDNSVRQYLRASDGKRYIVSELCGAVDAAGLYIPDSCMFIEASWVDNPAFPGAVVNYLIDLPAQSTVNASVAVTTPDFPEIWFNPTSLQNLRVADISTMVAIRLAIKELRADRYRQIVARIAADYGR